MGDVMRGTWYDSDGNGKKHWHWDKIVPIALSFIAIIVSLASLAVAVFK